MANLLEAINSERKVTQRLTQLFRDQNLKLLNKYALLDQDRTGLSDCPGFTQFAARGYRLLHEVKAVRI